MLLLLGTVAFANNQSKNQPAPKKSEAPPTSGQPGQVGKNPNPGPVQGFAPRNNRMGENQPKAGDWLRRYKDLPPAQQEQQLRNDPLFRRLAPERQQQLLNRLHNFNSMPSDERDRLLDRMQKFESLSPEQQQHLKQMNESLQQLPPARQMAVRQALRRLNEMTPEERARIFNAPRFQQMFSADEMGILKGMSGLTPQPPPANAPNANPSKDEPNPQSQPHKDETEDTAKLL